MQQEKQHGQWGGPTIELFANSYNAVQSAHTIELSIENKGYKQNTSTDWFTTKMNNGIYRSKSATYWWLASPSSNNGGDVYIVHDYRGYFSNNGVDYGAYARPVVCIPMSNFDSFTVEGN